MHWIYAHLIGDFIIQNDFMASGKKKSSLICLLHICTYMIPFLLCGLTWYQLVLIGVQHFFQDRTNVVIWIMKKKGSGYFATGPLSPWSIIVTDNILHILWIEIVLWLPIQKWFFV